jgi:4-hydroxysphinganine ceramide fatty acyl 2-hydroxylase
MKRSEFMIMDYPWLVKFFASRNPIHLLLFVVPVWLVSSSFILLSDKHLFELLLLFILGAIYWTFVEYGIHRWIYHIDFKNSILNYFLGSFHQYHHKRMDDRRVYNAGFLMVYSLVPILLIPFYFLDLKIDSLATIALGLSAGHFFYEYVHFILHYKVHDEGYLCYIQKYHFYHHDFAPLKNFGNTSHLWDYIFGTYDRNYMNYKMSANSEQSLITSNQLDPDAIFSGQ